MVEGTQSYAHIVDSVNQLQQQQERQQKQLKDTISIPVQEQETARVDSENREMRFNEMIWQISRISLNGLWVMIKQGDSSGGSDFYEKC